MIYTLVMLDKENGEVLRTPLRTAHRAYLAAVSERIAFAGPLVAEDGETITGSLIAVDFADRNAAQEWLRDEPYTRGGVYMSTQVHAFLNYWPQKVGFPMA